ncbi:hypothetical protein IFM89_025487 [Coptis chinensis]|uniref:C2H2-type domain-containing protein n=1 Tax=Coptis chinensis TaxID=261450 RepID=A0A835HPX6_9MAGN|nr:hypothetical protein IFM89_025487 [Coptis chinensis]
MTNKKGKKAPIPPPPIQFDRSEIKKEAKKALKALQCGNHNRALSLIKESCNHYTMSGELLRVQVAICEHLAASVDDTKLRMKYLKNAVEPARMAAFLSPNSIDFCLSYANLLYLTLDRSSPDEIIKIVDECNRGLAMEHPLDPDDDIFRCGSGKRLYAFQDESGKELSSPKERIAQMRKLLASLKAIASSIVDGHQKGNGNENKGETSQLETVSMKQKIPDYPLESNTKKATKTEQERRKEIARRVVTQRFLQIRQSKTDPQKSEYPEENLEDPQLSCRMVKHNRKKNADKSFCLQKKKEMVRPYWNSKMSRDEKQNLFIVNVKDLLAYYNTQKDQVAYKVILEAVSFAEDHKNWGFWECCSCNEAFSDSELHCDHVITNHLEGLSLEHLPELLPSALEDDWNIMITNGEWTPIDMSAAVPILEARWRQVSKLELSEIDSKQWAMSQVWPRSDDCERAQSLKDIQVLLKCILYATEHASLVIQYTIRKLQDCHPGLRLCELGFDKMHLCICMLGASELDKICTFLQELQKLCKRYSSFPKMIEPRQVGLVKERIVLDGDSLCILFDEQLLQGDSSLGTYNVESNYIDESSSATFVLDSDQRDSGRPNSDMLLAWIFADLSSEEQLQSWTQIREYKIDCGNKLLQILLMTYHILENICAGKADKLCYKEALKAIGGLCLEELNKRRCGTEYVPLSLVKVLSKRQAELVIWKNYDSRKNRSELDAISSVLEEAQREDVSQEQTWTISVITSMCDTKNFEDIDVTLQNYLNPDDIRLKETIERARRSTEFELIKSDALIIPDCIYTCEMAKKITQFAANDYRAILLPLVKSYIQAHLEKLAVKDAKDKSDAAKDALLDEVKIEDQKSVSNGGKQSKQMKKKSKKNNKKRRTVELKNSVGIDQLSAEQVCDPDASVGHQDFESVAALTGEGFGNQEERFQLQMEELAVLPTENVSTIDHTEADSINRLNKNMRPWLIEAAKFLTDRWVSAINEYNDPSIELSERPVMYSEYI